MACCGLVPGIPLDTSFNMLISGSIAVKGDIFHELDDTESMISSHSTDIYSFSLTNPNKSFNFTNINNNPNLFIKSDISQGFVGINTSSPTYNLDVSGTFRANQGLINDLTSTDISVNNILKTKYLVVNGVSIFDISGSVPAILYVNQVHAQEAFFTNYAEINDVSTNNVKAKNITSIDISTNNLYVSGDISAVDISFNRIQGPLGIITHIDSSDISLNRLQTATIDISSGINLNNTNIRSKHIDCSDISLNRLQTTNVEINNGIIANANARIIHIDCSDISLNRLQTTNVEINNGIIANANARIIHIDCSDISLNRLQTATIDISSGINLNNTNIRAKHIDCSDISLNRLQTTNVEINNGIIANANARIIHIDCSDISLNRLQTATVDISSGINLNNTNIRAKHIDCSDISLNRLQTTNVEINNGIIANANARIIHIDCSDISLNRLQTTNVEINNGIIANANARIIHIDCSDISLNRLQTTNVEINNGIIANANARIIHIDCSDISLNRIQTTNVEINNGIIANANARIIHIDCSDISLNRIQTTNVEINNGIIANANARIIHIDCSDISLNRLQTSTVDISNGINIVGNISASSLNNTPYDISLASTGNTLIVDQVFGNDTFGASNKYLYKFKTITAALSAASAGENVVVYPGTYNESLVIPNNVSLTGTAPQAVIIQKLNVVQDTSLIVVGSNCRLENFTANLSSSGNYNLTGIYFPSGTSITTKLRNSIWTITSSSTNSPTIIGVDSPGTSATDFTAVNAIQRSTINVISSSSGITRGIYVRGPNRFAVRDIVVYARGTGTNIVGVETTNASAYAELKTSTISGVLYDINRTAGEILLGFTDLKNNRANGNSFSVVTESSTTTFGIIGNLGNNSTYNIVPGVIPIGSLPGSAFVIPITQSMILFTGVANFSGTIGNGNKITLNIYKNAIVSPVYSIELTNANPKVVNMTQSVDFSQGDTYYATVVTTGNPNTGSFTGTLGFY